MKLIAVYHMPLREGLCIHLLDLNTADLTNVITDEDAGDLSLGEAAQAWATRNGHTIEVIDNQILRS